MKKALVVGCGPNVWEEVEKAQEMCDFDKIYCVKLAGVYWEGHFDVWVTLHPEFMDDYEKQRRKSGRPGGYEIVAPPSGEVGSHGHKGNIARRVSYIWPGMDSSASSGIYGAKVALDDGHDRVILAGIPMEVSKHFSRKTQWLERDSFLMGFKRSLKHLRGKVKSFSGLTKLHLGEPTPEWLQGDPVVVPSVEVQT